MFQRFDSKKILAVALLLWTSVPLSGTLVAFAYTNPGSPTGFVNDFAEMLTKSERQTLETKLSDFERSSSNEISVVIIPSLQGDTIENFAVKLFEEWKIGKEKNDNGVLLLISRNDREVRIEVGYGLEGAVTDAQSYWIIQNVIIPTFREGRYYEGIAGAVNVLIPATQGEYVTEGASPPTRINLENVWFLFFIIPMWLASILARSKSWWAGGVVGGIVGIILSFFFGFLFFGLTATAFLVIFGLFFDFIVSRSYEKNKSLGKRPPWWIGGGGFGSGHGGGGFGGFGGGMSGGGGASGKW